MLKFTSTPPYVPCDSSYFCIHIAVPCACKHISNRHCSSAMTAKASCVFSRPTSSVNIYMATHKDSSSLSVTHVFLVLLLLLTEESVFDTSSWPALCLSPLMSCWTGGMNVTKLKDRTLCAISWRTDVRNSEVESDNNVGLQFRDWQQTFGNGEIF